MKRFITLVLFAFSININAAYTEKQPLINAETLLTSIQKGDDLVILDVRSEKEFKAGHVPNSINVAHDEIAEHLDNLAGFKNKKVVVYCRSGRRAGVAELMLLKNGFKNVHHLEGDMNGWKSQAMPIVK